MGGACQSAKIKGFVNRRGSLDRPYQSLKQTLRVDLSNRSFNPDLTFPELADESAKNSV